MAAETLLGTAVVNVLILYNSVAVKPISVTEFREKVVCSLLKSTQSKEGATCKNVAHYLRDTDEREHGKGSDERK